MPHDPLKTLMRLRRQAVDEGRRNLATSLDAASAASDAVRRAELAIIKETDRASQPDGSDQLVEAFAAWLPGARTRVAQALALQDRQEAEVARRRAELTACRAALEAIEQLRAARQSVEDEALAKREARQIDEAASRPKIDRE
jgi:flagellar export protein FliJ